MSELHAWRRGSDRELLHTRIFSVRASRFEHPNRPRGKEFLTIDAPDWAIVVPVTPDGRLVTVRQFRFGVEAFSWELPGGVIDEGESAIDAAVRELAEETGYRGGTPSVLGVVHPNPAIQSNRSHIVLVPNVKLNESTQWDPDEELTVSLSSVAHVLAAARRGEVTHALMLNALFLFEPWWREQSWPDAAGI